MRLILIILWIMNNMLFQSRKSNALNIYSTAATKTEYRHRPTFCCVAIILFFGPLSLFLSSAREQKNDVFITKGHLVGSNRQARHQCWLKHAMKAGKFRLFSHRSYHDNTQSKQPTCFESLSNLKAIGVNHLDLDLVLNDNEQLVVAHPMEFKHQSKYYSPCARVGFDEMIRTLKTVYENNFFISMEPKAAWGNTPKELEDVALTNFPSSILKVLLKKITEHGLGGKCAAIVEIFQAHDEQELQEERNLLNSIIQHCELFQAVRLADEPPVTMGDYDALMPTIEFHPSHPHNVEEKTLPQSLWEKSIFWVVDTEADLALAATLRPYGVVTNSPKNIVDIVGDSSWCGDEEDVSSEWLG